MATMSGGVVERSNTINVNKQVLRDINKKYEFARRTQEELSVLFAKINSKNARELTKNMKSYEPAWENKNANALCYGPVPGIPLGSWWGIRMDCSRDRMHDPFTENIQHGPLGAVSICTAQSNEDVDLGDSFTFTGERYTNEDKLTTRLAADRDNGSLILSLVNQIPIRVIRSHNLSNEYSPKTGYRYDGLYMVMDYWIGCAPNNVKYHKFALKRVFNQEPPPWESTTANSLSNSRLCTSECASQRAVNNTIISRCISKKFQKSIDGNKNGNKLDSKSAHVSQNLCHTQSDRIIVSETGSSIASNQKSDLISDQKCGTSRVLTGNKTLPTGHRNAQASAIVTRHVSNKSSANFETSGDARRTMKIVNLPKHSCDLRTKSSICDNRGTKFYSGNIQKTNISIRTDLYDSSHNLKHREIRDSIVQRSPKAGPSTPRRQLHLAGVNSSSGSEKSMPSVIMERASSLQNTSKQNLSDTQQKLSDKTSTGSTMHTFLAMSTPSYPITRKVNVVACNNKRITDIRTDTAQSSEINPHLRIGMRKTHQETQKPETSNVDVAVIDAGLNDTRNADILDALYLHRVEHSYAMKSWRDAVQRTTLKNVDSNSVKNMKIQNISGSGSEDCNTKLEGLNVKDALTAKDVVRPVTCMKKHLLEYVSRSTCSNETTKSSTKTCQSQKIPMRQPLHLVHPTWENLESTEETVTKENTENISQPLISAISLDSSNTLPLNSPGRENVSDSNLSINVQSNSDPVASVISTPHPNCDFQVSDEANVPENTLSKSSLNALTIDKVLDIITQQKSSLMAKILIKNVIGLNPDQSQLSLVVSPQSHPSNSNSTKSNEKVLTVENRSIGTGNCESQVSGDIISEESKQPANKSTVSTKSCLGNGRRTSRSESERECIRTRSKAHQPAAKSDDKNPNSKNLSCTERTTDSRVNITDAGSSPYHFEMNTRKVNRSRNSDVSVKSIDKYSTRAKQRRLENNSRLKIMESVGCTRAPTSSVSQNPHCELRTRSRIAQNSDNNSNLHPKNKTVENINKDFHPISSEASSLGTLTESCDERNRNEPQNHDKSEKSNEQPISQFRRITRRKIDDNSNFGIQDANLMESKSKRLSVHKCSSYSAQPKNQLKLRENVPDDEENDRLSANWHAGNARGVDRTNNNRSSRIVSNDESHANDEPRSRQMISDTSIAPELNDIYGDGVYQLQSHDSIAESYADILGIKWDPKQATKNVAERVTSKLPIESSEDGQVPDIISKKSTSKKLLNPDPSVDTRKLQACENTRNQRSKRLSGDLCPNNRKVTKASNVARRRRLEIANLVIDMNMNPKSGVSMPRKTRAACYFRRRNSVRTANRRRKQLALDNTESSPKRNIKKGALQNSRLSIPERLQSNPESRAKSSHRVLLMKETGNKVKPENRSTKKMPKMKITSKNSRSSINRIQVIGDKKAQMPKKSCKETRLIMPRSMEAKRQANRQGRKNLEMNILELRKSAIRRNSCLREIKSKQLNLQKRNTVKPQSTSARELNLVLERVKLDQQSRESTETRSKMVDVTTQCSPTHESGTDSRQLSTSHSITCPDGRNIIHATNHVPNCLPSNSGSGCFCGASSLKSTTDPVKIELIDLVKSESEDDSTETVSSENYKVRTPGRVWKKRKGLQSSSSFASTQFANSLRPTLKHQHDPVTNCIPATTSALPRLFGHLIEPRVPGNIGSTIEPVTAKQIQDSARYSIESIDHSNKNNGFVRYRSQRPMAFVPKNSSEGNLTTAQLKLIGFKPIKSAAAGTQVGDESTECGRGSSIDSPKIFYSSAVVKRSVHEEYDKYTNEENNVVRYMDNELCYEDIENEDGTSVAYSDSTSESIIIEKMEFTKFEMEEDRSESSELYGNEDSKHWNSQSDENSQDLEIDEPVKSEVTLQRSESPFEEETNEPWHGWTKVASNEKR